MERFAIKTICKDPKAYHECKEEIESDATHCNFHDSLLRCLDKGQCPESWYETVMNELHNCPQSPIEAKPEDTKKTGSRVNDFQQPTRNRRHAARAANSEELEGHSDMHSRSRRDEILSRVERFAPDKGLCLEPHVYFKCKDGINPNATDCQFQNPLPECLRKGECPPGMYELVQKHLRETGLGFKNICKDPKAYQECKEKFESEAGDYDFQESLLRCLDKGQCPRSLYVATMIERLNCPQSPIYAKPEDTKNTGTRVNDFQQATRNRTYIVANSEEHEGRPERHSRGRTDKVVYRSRRFADKGLCLEPHVYFNCKDGINPNATHCQFQNSLQECLHKGECPQGMFELVQKHLRETGHGCAFSKQNCTVPEFEDCVLKIKASKEEYIYYESKINCWKKANCSENGMEVIVQFYEEETEDCKKYDKDPGSLYQDCRENVRRLECLVGLKQCMGYGGLGSWEVFSIAMGVVALVTGIAAVCKFLRKRSKPETLAENQQLKPCLGERDSPV